MADALQGAGDFTVDELSLITTSGLRVNLIPNVVKLTIFEDINQSCISGTITIQDSMNLSSHGPIIGQEFLSMKVRTSSVQDDDGIIDFTENLLAVHSLTAREKVGNNVQIYNLSFVSMELVRNQRIKVKKSFTLPWSDIVLSMLVNHLETKKRGLILEPLQVCIMKNHLWNTLRLKRVRLLEKMVWLILLKI